MVITRELSRFGGIQIDQDLSGITSDSILKLVKSIPQYKYILIRGQNFEKKDLLNFAQKIGPVNIRKGTLFYSDTDVNEITRVTNERDELGHKTGIFAESELCWHCNGMLRSNIKEVTLILYCVKNGEKEFGITSFCNTRRAYCDLPAEIKNIVDKIDVKISFKAFVGEVNTLHESTGSYKILPEDPEYKVFSGEEKNDEGGTSFNSELEDLYKPLVCTHPLDGLKSLYFAPNFIVNWRHRDGLSFNSKKLWDYLSKHTYQEKYIYNHVWESGDIILCDQWYTMHKRSKVKGDRLLWRICVGNSSLS